MRSGRAFLARYGLLVPLFAGAGLLAAAEFSPLYEVRAMAAVLDEPTAGSNHGYALLVIALALVPMGLGAVAGGSRPASAALVALALAAVAIIAAVDAPDVDATGIYARTYEAARAGPRAGFYLECAGAALALTGAAATLVMRPGRGARRAGRRPAAALD